MNYCRGGKDEKDSYQALKQQNQHLSEKLSRTVEALLTLQAQQTTYHTTKIGLQQELNELRIEVTKLQNDLHTQEQKAQKWKHSFESVRFPCP